MSYASLLGVPIRYTPGYGISPLPGFKQVLTHRGVPLRLRILAMMVSPLRGFVVLCSSSWGFASLHPRLWNLTLARVQTGSGTPRGSATLTHPRYYCIAPKGLCCLMLLFLGSAVLHPRLWNLTLARVQTGSDTPRGSATLTTPRYYCIATVGLSL